MRRIIILIGAIIVAAMVGLTTVFALTAETFIRAHQHDFLGLSLEVDDIDINWVTNNVSLEDVKIYPTGKKGEKHLLVSAKELEFKVNIFALLFRTIEISEIEMDGPKIRYISTRRGSNWDVLDLGELEDERVSKKKKDDKEWSFWKIKIDKVEIDDGEVVWRDLKTGGKFEMTDVDAKLKNLVTEPDPEKLPSRMVLDAKLKGSNAPLNVKGRLNLFSDTLNMKLKAKLKGAPLTYFAPFYSGNVPFKITSGTISINSNVKVFKDYLNSTHYAAVLNLRAKGIKGKIVTELIENTGGSVNVTTTVNGDLKKGNLRVSSAISKNISKALLAKVKELSPATNVEKTIKSTGSKIKASAKKLFSGKK